jgi:coenzyme F420-reducing hydrogenase beta subunit
MFEEKEGLSLIVSRSWRGEELVKAAIEAGYIDAEDLDEDKIASMQPGQLKKKQLVQSRLFCNAPTGDACAALSRLSAWRCRQDSLAP